MFELVMSAQRIKDFGWYFVLLLVAFSFDYVFSGYGFSVASLFALAMFLLSFLISLLQTFYEIIKENIEE